MTDFVQPIQGEWYHAAARSAKAGSPMTTRAVQQKIARLATGGMPRVLDLFSGCGGLSLGFKAAGFEIRAAIEFDPEAARSHGRAVANAACGTGTCRRRGW